MGLVPHDLVLAHQGGWDEMLMVLAPILLFVGLLRMANKRAEAMQAQGQPPAESVANGPVAGGPTVGGPDSTGPDSEA